MTCYVGPLVLAMAVAGASGSIAAAQEPARAFSIEGAWAGTATFDGYPPTPSMDTFTSNATTPRLEGTLLCTIPPGPYQTPLGWFNMTSSAHGSWKRIGKNEYAFDAWRTLLDLTGTPVGRARFWGVITPVSETEYTGTMNMGFYDLAGTPLLPPLVAAMSSSRIQVVQ
jgi:hypothetical protein